MDPGRRVVIGLGNEYRRDDGIGPRLVAELAAGPDLPGTDLRIADGDPARLLDMWAGAELAVVVDALPAGAGRPGTWVEISLTTSTVAPDTAGTGTHAIGLGSTVALGRLLDRMPRRLVVVGVRGLSFGFGTDLSAPVRAAMTPLGERVRRLVSEPPLVG